MPKFTIIEAQDCRVTRLWRYEVEANDEQAALEACHDGKADPVDIGESGDWDYGDSGWAVVGGGDEAKAITEADEDMHQRA